MRLAVGALVVLVACSEHEKVDPAACNAAAKADMDRTAEYMEAHGTSNEHAKKLGELLRALTARRCIDDEWPADVVACYREAPRYEDLLVCYHKLPEALKQRLEDAQKALVLSLDGAGSDDAGSTP